jgi:hypothetical protein
LGKVEIGVSYITAEGSIEDNVLVHEVRVDVASAATVESHIGRAPVFGDRSPVLDISGDAVAWKEPDIDAGALPLHSVDAASNIVEVVAIWS